MLTNQASLCPLNTAITASAPTMGLPRLSRRPGWCFAHASRYSPMPWPFAHAPTPMRPCRLRGRCLDRLLRVAAPKNTANPGLGPGRIIPGNELLSEEHCPLTVLESKLSCSGRLASFFPSDASHSTISARFRYPVLQHRLSLASNDDFPRFHLVTIRISESFGSIHEIYCSQPELSRSS